MRRPSISGSVILICVPLLSFSAHGQEPATRTLLSEADVAAVNSSLVATVGKPYVSGIEKRELENTQRKGKSIPLSGSKMSFDPAEMKDVAVRVQYAPATLLISGENVAGQDDDGEFYLQFGPANYGMRLIDAYGVYPTFSSNVTQEMLDELRGNFANDLAVLDAVTEYHSDGNLAKEWPLSARRVALYRAFVASIVKSKDSLYRLSVGDLVIFISLHKTRPGDKGVMASGLVFDSKSGAWLSDLTVGWIHKENNENNGSDRLDGILKRVRLAN